MPFKNIRDLLVAINLNYSLEPLHCHQFRFLPSPAPCATLLKSIIVSIMISTIFMCTVSTVVNSSI